jgi:hypothetical protein
METQRSGCLLVAQHSNGNPRMSRTDGRCCSRIALPAVRRCRTRGLKPNVIIVIVVGLLCVGASLRISGLWKVSEADHRLPTAQAPPPGWGQRHVDARVGTSMALPADPGGGHVAPREDELARLKAEYGELMKRVAAAEAAAERLRTELISARQPPPPQSLPPSLPPPLSLVGGVGLGSARARYRINVFVNLRLHSLKRLCASLLSAFINEPVSIVFIVEARQVNSAPHSSLPIHSNSHACCSAYLCWGDVHLIECARWSSSQRARHG